MGDFLIYGATGYTGRLIAEHAVERGLNPVLAGRRAEAVRALADRLRLRHRVFGLESRKALVEGLNGMTAVLHAAGPFSATSAPMAEACIAAGVHYCDVTGEIDVFEDLADLDARAKAVGIMLMPGVGFDVVPSDCLAAHVVARLPNAARLRLSIGGLTKASRGHGEDDGRSNRTGHARAFERPHRADERHAHGQGRLRCRPSSDRGR